MIDLRSIYIWCITGEGGIVNSADREAFASFGEEKWRAKFLLKRHIGNFYIGFNRLIYRGVYYAKYYGGNNGRGKKLEIDKDEK